MYGAPKIMQTREDFNLAFSMAEDGKADRQTVANHFAGLIESAKNYVFDRELEDGQKPSGGMPEYCIVDASEKNPKRVQLKLEYSETARIFQLGYTPEEVRSIISKLESK